MNEVTVEDVFRAVKEYGSVKNAARALKIKGSKIYYMKKKHRWAELESDFKKGKIKIKKKDPRELVDARSNQFIQERIGKAIKVSDVPRTPQLKLRQLDSKPNKKVSQEDEEMAVEAKEVTEEQRAEFYQKGYNKAVEEYESGMKELMDKVKEVEKAKEKVEIQRDASRNVNEQLEKRLDAAKTEINNYKAAGDSDEREELEAESNKLKNLNGKLRAELKETKRELASEKRCSERLSDRLKELKSVTTSESEAEATDPDAEFYKDTMNLYYEKFKQLKKA